MGPRVSRKIGYSRTSIRAKKGVSPGAARCQIRNTLASNEEIWAARRRARGSGGRGALCGPAAVFRPLARHPDSRILYHGIRFAFEWTDCVALVRSTRTPRGRAYVGQGIAPMPFMPFNILGIWFRGLLAVAIIAGGVYLLKRWYDESQVIVPLGQADPEAVLSHGDVRNREATAPHRTPRFPVPARHEPETAYLGRGSPCWRGPPRGGRSVRPSRRGSAVRGPRRGRRPTSPGMSGPRGPSDHAARRERAAGRVLRPRRRPAGRHDPRLGL